MWISGFCFWLFGARRPQPRTGYVHAWQVVVTFSWTLSKSPPRLRQVICCGSFLSAEEQNVILIRIWLWPAWARWWPKAGTLAAQSLPTEAGSRDVKWLLFVRKEPELVCELEEFRLDFVGLAYAGWALVYLSGSPFSKTEPAWNDGGSFLTDSPEWGYPLVVFILHVRIGWMHFWLFLGAIWIQFDLIWSAPLGPPQMQPQTWSMFRSCGWTIQQVHCQYCTVNVCELYIQKRWS